MKTLKQLLEKYHYRPICFDYDITVTEIIKEWLTQKRQIMINFSNLDKKSRERLIDELLEEINQ